QPSRFHVPYCERIVSCDSRSQAVDSPLLVSVYQNLRVRMIGPVSMSRRDQLASQRLMIVDLPVESHPDRLVLIRHRLYRGIAQVDYREPSVSQYRTSIGRPPHARAVGPAMDHSVTGAYDLLIAGGSCAVELEHAENSAHIRLPFRTAARGPRCGALKEVVPPQRRSTGIQSRSVRREPPSEHGYVCLNESTLLIALHLESALSQQRLHLSARTNSNRHGVAERAQLRTMAAPIIQRHPPSGAQTPRGQQVRIEKAVLRIHADQETPLRCKEAARPPQVVGLRSHVMQNAKRVDEVERAADIGLQQIPTQDARRRQSAHREILPCQLDMPRRDVDSRIDRAVSRHLRRIDAVTDPDLQYPAILHAAEIEESRNERRFIAVAIRTQIGKIPRLAGRMI